MSDVWVPSDAEAHRSTELPSVTKVFSDALNDLFKNFGGYLTLGLGMLVVALPLVFVGLFLFYAIFGGVWLGSTLLGALPGTLIGNDDLAASGSAIGMTGGMLFGLFLGLFAMVMLTSTALAPITASIYRAIWANMTRQQPLTFGGAFSTATQDLFTVVGFVFLTLVTIFTGALFCYIPGLIIGMFLHWGMCAVAIHRLSIAQAARLSIRHVQAHFGWSVGAFLFSMLIGIVASNIPIIGMCIGVTLGASYNLRLYRIVFGDGPEPRLQ